MPRLSRFIRIDDSAERWLYRTAHKSYWKVARFIEIDDLYQDGQMIYVKCARRYPQVNRAHLMALFKTSFHRHLINLANRNRYSIGGADNSLADLRGEGNVLSLASLRPAGATDDGWMDSIFGSCESLGPFFTLLNEARGPLKRLLALYLTEDGVARRAASRRLNNESLNEYMCRMIGVDSKAIDMPETLLSFLRGTGVYHLRRKGPT